MRRVDEHIAVIAEIKRRSPSKGALALDLDAAATAKAYADGGAAALSVLTDAPFFGGSVADLQIARETVELPVLRKDFTIDEVQVYETRAIGADAILLIVAAIPDDAVLADLHALADDLGLGVLVEAHDEREIERALLAGARVRRHQQSQPRDVRRGSRCRGVAGGAPSGRCDRGGGERGAERERRGADGRRRLRCGLGRRGTRTRIRPRRAAGRAHRIGRRTAGGLMFVKICGITNEDDALLATALGADALGFVFAPSTRQVHAEGVRDIVKRLPPDVLPVGVFRNERPEHIIEIAGRVGLHARATLGFRAALGGALDPRACSLRHPGLRGRRSRAGRGCELAGRCRAGRFSEPGFGKVFDWRLAEGAPGGVRLMIAGGLTPENVGDAIRLVRPWGVDVSTGVEARPGQKDPRKLRRFIELARAASAEPGDEYAMSAEERGDLDFIAGVTRPWDWQLDQ